MNRVNPFRGRRRGGFTLFECLVAMFIMLVGLMGIVAVFTSGVRSRILAQELIISQELGNMWADWVRFRLNSSGLGSNALGFSDLTAGAHGDFYSNSGDLVVAPADSAENLPTYHANGYAGYKWRITAVSDFVPQWMDGTDMHPWDKRKDGASLIPAELGSGPQPLKSVELAIYHGGGEYKFTYIFSGVGLKYAR